HPRLHILGCILGIEVRKDLVRPRDLISVKSKLVTQDLTEEAFAPDAELAVDRGHATGSLVGGEHQRRIQTHPVVEGVRTVEPGEAFEVDLARASHLRQIVGGLPQRSEDDLDVLVVTTGRGWVLIHFFPPEVGPCRNSSTSPSRIMYYLPSMRTCPLAFAYAFDPASLLASKRQLS